MDNKRRNALLKGYNHLYKRHLQAGGDNCFYCGYIRECLDHRPPIILFDDLSSKDFRDAKVPLCLIPSCMDCNKRLGAKPLLFVEDALEYLIKTLENEYQKKSTLWSEDEIKEMSPRFQSMIRSKQIALQELHNRICFMQKRILETDMFPVFLLPDDAYDE